MNDIERRGSAGNLAMTTADGGRPRIAGYAAVFGALSDDLGGFRERIEPGAFADAIRDSDTVALWNHNPTYVLGRRSAGTLALAEDSRGLFVTIDPPEAGWARDLLRSIERGDIRGQSFGFRVAPKGDRWEKHDGGRLRVISRFAALVDVGPSSIPAYPDTTLALRSLADAEASQAEARRSLLAALGQKRIRR